MNKKHPFVPKSSDLIFTTERSLFAKTIRWMTRLPTEEPTVASHVAGVSTRHNQKTVLEALFKVKNTKYNLWVKDHSDFEIWRHSLLTKEQRLLIESHAKAYTDNFYGFWKLFLHGFDAIVSKVFNKDLFVARRIMFSHTYPICNWVWSYPYYDVIKYTFGTDPKFTTPDSMHDHVVESGYWELKMKVVNNIAVDSKKLGGVYGMV